MDARLVIACAHCGSPVPGVVDPAQAAFCCAGCRTAAEVIRACGLGDYHRLRASLGTVAPIAIDGEPIADDAAYADEVVMRRDGLAAIAWHVVGVRCAACVWLLERMSSLLPGVAHARVDLAMACLTVVYEPARTSPAAQVAIARTLGYQLRPYADANAGRARVRERRVLMSRFVVALASAMGSMHLGLNVTAGDIAGDMTASTRTFFAAASFIAALPALTWSAAPWWQGAKASLRARRWTLDATVAATLASAIVAGVVGALAGGAVYADAAAMFVCLMLAARLGLDLVLDQAARDGAAIDGVLPRTARLLTGSGERVVATAALAPGDHVRVAAGEVLPCDGIADDAGWVETAVLTGESRAVAIVPGDIVLAGARSRTDLTLRATAIGGATRVGQLLARARLSVHKPRPDSIADRMQAGFAPTVGLLAVFAAIWWWPAGPRTAIDQALAMILVCCPCALGLAGPLVRAVGISGATRRGILLRDPDVFERLRHLRHAVLDKTGTLTAGATILTRWDWIGEVNGSTRALVESAALACESRSRHPAAGAVAAWLANRGVSAGAITDWREVPGGGIACTIAGRELRIGSGRFAAGEAGDGPLIALDGVPVARLRLDDPPLPEAAAQVARLRACGLTVHICSGDGPDAVASVAAAVGVVEVHAAQSPEDKARVVAELARDGGVLMVGDGVNDAPALSAADVGIGVRGGLEPCLECCGAFVARGGLAGAVDLFEASRRTASAERLCLAVSLAYNLAGVVAVLVGLAGPLVCAAAMPASSATVVLLAWWRAQFRSGGTGTSDLVAAVPPP